MTTPNQKAGLASDIAQELPYLRRYARALCGTQGAGDHLAARTLEAIMADRSLFSTGVTVRTGLFRTFHTIWADTITANPPVAEGIKGRVLDHLSQLPRNTREALLLRTIEEFEIAEIAQIMATGEDEVRALLIQARADIRARTSGKILVIEDEQIIAADLTAIVEGLGHVVIGVGQTRAAAFAIGRASRPQLILADIQLADDSSGIDAVNDLLVEWGDIPVIFVTAFPEKLLTGNRPEPAFLISKPYREAQVESAVSQAMFFASTETLRG